MRIGKVVIVGATVLFSGCGTPTEVRDFGLARLDVASALMPNPQVVSIGSLQARVRMQTLASDCSEAQETRVSERNGRYVVAPYVHEPRRCSTRGARIFLHETVLTFTGSGSKTVVVRTLGESRDTRETEVAVEVER
jgi:hypothetical protein